MPHSGSIVRRAFPWCHGTCVGCRNEWGDLAIGAFGVAPYGATKRVSGVLKWAGNRVRTLPLGLSVGLLIGDTTRARSVPTWAGNSIRTLPLGPSVELPVGHEACEGCAEMGGETHANPVTGAFGGAHYGATKRVKDVPTWAGNSMRTLPLGPSVELPIWDHDACEGCAETGGEPHANLGTRAFGGAPDGATARSVCVCVCARACVCV
eukprot:6111956-Pyramimonas_sp.AAC.3